MPWSPTSSFPHPLVNLRTSQFGAGPANYWSYYFISYMTWQGLADLINSFRQNTLGLEEIHLTDGSSLLEVLKIPITYCWSSGLIPKPGDWGSHIDVCGFFFRKPPKYSPPLDLEVFLRKGRIPVYIGFGSIVADDPNGLTRIVLEAIELLGIRAIISTGWSSLVNQDDVKPNDIYFLQDDCPHKWLFPQVAAVVHHGGAGTTACGLKYGRPTAIVPFFGDQLFWGEMVATAGAGPSPVPHRELNATRLAEAIQFCLGEHARAAAALMAKQMEAENGVQAAVTSFHRHMSNDQMACDILPQLPAVWKYSQGGLNLKLSGHAAQALMKRLEIRSKDLEL